MQNKYGLTIIKDYPIKGVNFIDINGLLANPEGFALAIEGFCQQIKDFLPAEKLTATAIIAPEARGFIFAAPVAYKMGIPLVLIRKKGKIPNKPYAFHITNEYTNYDMEVDEDLLNQYQHFIYIDDILATGQTLAAVRNALAAKGKEMVLSLHLTAVDVLENKRAQNKDLQNLPIKVLI